MNNDRIYELITAKNLRKKLEKGIVPWRMEWTTNIPINKISKQKYNGINRLMLHSSGYTHNEWVTFNQTRMLGGQVKSGEKGYPIIFWKLWSPTKKQEVDSKEG